MNYPTAIVVSAGLIAGVLLTSQGHSQPASARYAIAGDGAAGAWVLDVRRRHAVGLQTRRKQRRVHTGPHGQTVVSLAQRR